MITRFALASLLCSIVLVAGCFETPFVLGSDADAKVDSSLCGDWEVGSKNEPDKPKARMFIRNLDGKHYLVEWVNPPEENQKPEEVETLRMIAWTAKVGDAMFAHARNLPPDGSIAQKHLVIRFTVADGNIELRNLNDDFFKNNVPHSDAEFRQLVEENIENADMYDQGEMLATRVGK